MSAGNETVAGAAAPALDIIRVFDAPRSLVFKVWTEQEHLSRWCAPKGFSIPHNQGDLRKGGAWRSCMVSPNGVEYWVGGEYREIVPDERLVFTHVWDEEERHETLVTIRFEDAGNGKTRMHFRQQFFRSVSSRDGHEGGWTESFERLAEYLEALPDAA